ncbi:MAG: hypothetical protein F7C07_02020 [Desulfurococcales archaeon]|nr:hypothetical protein [Desulfurococcales archaeon]
MERIRLSMCDKLFFASRTAEKLFNELVEAVDRIPAIVAGRSYVERAAHLSRGLMFLLSEVLEENCGGLNSSKA